LIKEKNRLQELLVEHQKLEFDISNKLAKSETLNLFINTIKKAGYIA